MAQISVHRAVPFFHRGLCLLLAGLTACGPTRNPYVRKEAGMTDKTAGRPEPIQVVETWGTKESSPSGADPALAPGCLLTLHCLADSRLNGDFRIDFNGDLPLPYDIKINTKDLTLSQLHKKIMDQLRPYFKVPSDVDVTLKERHYWLDVRGLVQKPARFLVEPGTSLDEVIGLAGGFSKETPPAYVRFQKGNKVLVINLNQYYSQAFDHPQLLGWVGGEVIFFQKDISVLTVEHPSSALYRPPVHVLGEVKKPGDYPLESGSDLVDTIVEAGGFTDRADLDNIEMIRKTLTGKRTRRLSWDNLSGAPALQQGDIVIVHADIVTRSERRITMWATVISVLATIVTAWVLVAAYNKGRI